MDRVDSRDVELNDIIARGHVGSGDSSCDKTLGIFTHINNPIGATETDPHPTHLSIAAQPWLHGLSEPHKRQILLSVAAPKEQE